MGRSSLDQQEGRWANGEAENERRGLMQRTDWVLSPGRYTGRTESYKKINNNSKVGQFVDLAV